MNTIRRLQEDFLRPGLIQPADEGGDPVMAADDVEPAFSGPLLPLLGHKADGMGTMMQGDTEHFLRHGHLQVQGTRLVAEQAGQAGDIRVGDMPAVLTQVGGDAVGPRGQGLLSRPYGVWRLPPTRIPHRCHMVNIDAKSQLPGHTSGLRQPTAAGILDRQGRQFGRQGVGRIGRNIQRRERHQWHADIGPSARAIYDTGRRDDRSTGCPDRGDTFARAKSRGDDVLDHHNLLARLDMETAPQSELAALAFDIHRRHAQPARGLIAGDDAADGWRNGHVHRPDRRGDLLRQCLAKPRAPRRVHEHQVLLQENGAVQPRGQHKMPFTKGTGSAEFVEYVV